MTKPVLRSEALYGLDGAFVFDHELALSWRAKLAAGLAVLTLAGSLSSSIYPMGHQQILVGRSLAMPTLVNSVVSRTAAVTGHPTAETSSISSQSEQSPKLAPPATSSTSSTMPEAPKQTAPQSSLRREVFGFLPYWEVKKVSNIQYNRLSTMAYFGVAMNGDGSFNQDENGWHWLSDPATQSIFSEAKQHGTRLVITFGAFDTDQIADLVNDAGTRDRAATNMVAMAKSQGAMGANIDFEDEVSTDGTIRANLVTFADVVTKRFHQDLPGSEVTVSTPAMAAHSHGIYDVQKLASVSDGLVIMAYNFYTAGSSKAEPAAPLHGYPGTYWYDVTSAVTDHISAGAPANKLILGVPYYGYDWPTVDDSAHSDVVPGGTGGISSYHGSVTDPNNNSQTRKWDDVAQQPYYTYQVDGQWRVAYYEDAASLGKKYDLVNQYNLKGVGLWTLGQEGDAPELWQLLADKFSH